jgi:hypothetical protein
LWITLVPKPKAGTNKRKEQSDKDIFDHARYVPINHRKHNDKQAQKLSALA